MGKTDNTYKRMEKILRHFTPIEGKKMNFIIL